MASVSGSPVLSNTTARVNSLSVSLPSHVDGDLLCIFGAVGAGPSLTISGWTKHANTEVTGGQCGGAWFTKAATGTDSEGSSVSMTWSGTTRQAVAVAYKVVDWDAIEDSDSIQISTNSASWAIPSLDAVGADSLYLAGAGLQNTSIVPTLPSGFSNLKNPDADGAQAISGATGEDAVGDGATGTVSWSISPSSRGFAAGIVISNAAAAETATTNIAFDAEQIAEGTAAKTANTNAAFHSGPDYESALAKAIGTNFAIDAGLIANLAILKAAIVNLEYNSALSASTTASGPSLVPWEPVAGHVGYIWQEGAAWTEVSAASLGITESTADIAVPIEDHVDANRDQRSSYTLPAGTFQLTTELRIGRSQKRIIGAGSDNTIIQVSGSGKIVFGGSDGSTSNIVGSPSRGDTTVTVLDASICEVGDIIAIKQEGEDTVTGTDDNTAPYSVGTISQEAWAEDPWMQMARVTAVDEGTDVITFTPALALDYDTLRNPYVKAFNCDYDLGIEGVTIEFLVDNGNRAVEFDRIERGYAKDVRIYDYAKYGLACRECFEIEIHECRIIGAQDTGTGGNGYSISAELGTTFLHAHDNAMKGPHRHPLIIATGASHCVFAHNYIAEDSAENLTTLSIHGHDCHHNLFEGNIIQGTIEINDFYPATRQNVLYRNKVIYDSDWWDATSREYAFWIRRNSEAACVANRLSGFANVARIFDGSEGSLVDANGASDAVPSYGGDSRYLVAKPTSSIWSAYSWPVFSGDTDGTIPAEAFNLLVEKDTEIEIQVDTEALAQLSKAASTAVESAEELSHALTNAKSAIIAFAALAGQTYESTEAKTGSTNVEGKLGASNENTKQKTTSTAFEYQQEPTGRILIAVGLQAFIAPSFQAEISGSLTNAKTGISNIDAEIGSEAAITGSKTGNTNIAHYAEGSYSIGVSIQLSSSFSAEFQAGLSQHVTTSRQAFTAIEVQNAPRLEFSLAKRGFVNIEYDGSGTIALTHQTGHIVNIQFDAGANNQFLNAEITVPSVIDIALEHLHTIETGVEGIHSIDLGLEAIHTITISIERTE